MQAAACGRVCDPCGVLGMGDSMQGHCVCGTECVCARPACGRLHLRAPCACASHMCGLCLVKRCVCGWLQAVFARGAVRARVCVTLWGCELRVPARCAGLQPVCKL